MGPPVMAGRLSPGISPAGVVLGWEPGPGGGAGVARLARAGGWGGGPAGDGGAVVPGDLAGGAVVGVEAVAGGGAGELAAAAAAAAGADGDRAVALDPAGVGDGEDPNRLRGR